MPDYSDLEARRITNTLLNNKQVRWIAIDTDVEAFAQKIIGFSKAAATQAIAAELEAMLKSAHTAEAEASQ